MKKTICFDLDNVICRTTNNDYKNSKPKKEVIKKINSLYENGHFIKIFTSRFMGRSKERISLAKKRGLKFTKKQLGVWGLKYNQLIFGKPSYDIYIDDKSIFFNKNWTNKIDSLLK